MVPAFAQAMGRLQQEVGDLRLTALERGRLSEVMAAVQKSHAAEVRAATENNGGAKSPKGSRGTAQQ